MSQSYCLVQICFIIISLNFKYLFPVKKSSLTFTSIFISVLISVSLFAFIVIFQFLNEELSPTCVLVALDFAFNSKYCQYDPLTLLYICLN